ncbi:hypothetical protein O3M35_008348 [Rhynocoris fuscipes]|uniref:Uncharacterized protein n=1 Tax=Rhynocoris fuscipes TaxID=488301 RepID=A0AAW1DBP1_9HEMI
MDDSEIQETVESILGKGARVVDCEKKSTIREEEVLLVNGCPIRLEGAEGAVIRDALLHGTAPHSDILNQILIRAGILSAPVRLETSLSVKSTVVTREQVTVARGGRVIDGRSRETKEDNYYSSTTSEVWEPSGTSGSDDTSSLTSVTKDDKFFSTSSSSNTERSSITEEDSPSSSVDDFLGHDVTDRISGMHINGFQVSLNT